MLWLVEGLGVRALQPREELLHTVPGAQAGAASSAVQLAPAATAGSHRLLLMLLPHVSELLESATVPRAEA